MLKSITKFIQKLQPPDLTGSKFSGRAASYVWFFILIALAFFAINIFAAWLRA